MKIFFDTMEAQRRAAGPFIAVVVWLMAPIVVAESFFTGGSLVGACACAALATIAGALLGGTTLGRALSGVALMGQVSLLVANGGSWQIDLHMAYFAALALLIAYADWVAILAAAATVAVHHLALNYLFPLAVFPDSADLGRVLLHAVILVAEAGALIWVCINLDNIFTASSQLLARSEKSAAEARASNARAEEAFRAQAAAEQERRQAEEQAIGRERALVSQSIGAGLAKLSTKDLSFRMTGDAPEAYRQLQEDFNTALAQLESAMLKVVDGARTIDATVGQISVATDDLSGRTEEQAAGLEETTAALAEITSTVKRAAENAHEASVIVSTTKSDARSSGEVVHRAVEAIERIEKSSQSIGQIIGVIDEIAFQTNLLALNAGVEAARAGDAGKGFAVVASEVRALAQRSAEAAKQIKELVATSSSEVSQGVQLVGETTSALEKIVTQIVEIDRVVAEIAQGAKEQATTLSHINSALNRMEENTQKNASMIEETNAATAQLRSETASLVQAVDSFAVTGRESTGAKVRAAPASVSGARATPALKTMARENGGGAVRKFSEAPEEDWAEF
ncbi:methyl-accepting chemotaxis protein [Methylocystis sp. WRRC1]|uniref:methyl-accepting chemotaxis protein n=1 Tax=Methylocystis sp. WRRC1 TaxID=1732014 RepID=UPI001D13BD37|nr:methyl-accepting chemotaxis protein [Methylocystis sp. WRRC1]MCC3245132.1 methyl-accepting chemotaxis protein [Methylocystis sp. WRRC1]